MTRRGDEQMHRNDGTAETFALGDVVLESGETLAGGVLGYRCAGALSEARDNCVLLFTYYTGTDASYEPWIGPGRALDPDRHFIVVVDHLGGGVSSSPSNVADAGAFPRIDVADTVSAARALLVHLGVRHVALAAGWSLGGIHALEFAASHPGLVSSVLAVCSAARCAPINRVFLDGVESALAADPDLAVADPQRPPLAGLDAFGRVYAGWAYSEQFFAERIYEQFGYADAGHVLAEWGRDHQRMHAGDLLASLRMWRQADIGAARGGTERALAGLDARTILMPSTTDRYFTVAENRWEAEHLPNGFLRALDSPLGHIAGRPGIREQEQEQVDECLRELVDG
ncbi:alpha/beta fold hydrolase [Microbacterium sp. gxy059]|uniref:alpha/beta fold hydrolase n=1 Tax=Microbacterium sp. gxy059 TaxID=2957199 RepID=UPI003D96391F